MNFQTQNRDAKVTLERRQGGFLLVIEERVSPYSSAMMRHVATHPNARLDQPPFRETVRRFVHEHEKNIVMSMIERVTRLSKEEQSRVEAVLETETDTNKDRK